MKIELMRLSNYGPYYGDHAFAWNDRGLTVVLGENKDEPRMNSNGSGKSALADALDWCLFGEIPRADHVDSIVNELAARDGAECTVSTLLRDEDNSVYKVIRSRGKRRTKLSLEVDGEDRTTRDVKETQKAVERILGLDRKIFHAAVLFSQTDLVRYADATDTDRMKILSKILQLEKLDDYLTWTKGEKSKVEAALANAKRDRMTLTSEISALDTTIRNLGVQAGEYESKRSMDLQAHMNTCAEYQARIAENSVSQATIDKLVSIKNEHVRALQSMVPPELNPIELRDLTDALSEIDSSVGGLLAQKRNFSDRLAKFTNGLGPRCNVCEQPITGEWSAKQRIEIDRSLQDIMGQINHAVTKRTTINAQIFEIQENIRVASTEYTRHTQELQNKVAEIDRSLSEHKYKTQAAIEDKRALARVESLIVKLQTEVNPYEQLLVENKERLYSIQCNLKTIENEITRCENSLAVIDFWVAGFGPKGLKSYILDARLAEMSEAANEWLKIFTGGTMWVKFESQKKTRTNKLVNAPHLIINRMNPDGTITERNYNSWSGGQKRRIAFCVDFGLTKLLARRASKSYDLIILDEVFRHLDVLGKEAAVEMLEALAGEKSSIFAIEHDSGFESRFKNVVKVVHENMRSRVEE